MIPLVLRVPPAMVCMGKQPKTSNAAREKRAKRIVTVTVTVTIVDDERDFDIKDEEVCIVDDGQTQLRSTAIITEIRA